MAADGGVRPSRFAGDDDGGVTVLVARRGLAVADHRQGRAPCGARAAHPHARSPMSGHTTQRPYHPTNINFSLQSRIFIDPEHPIKTKLPIRKGLRISS